MSGVAAPVRLLLARDRAFRFERDDQPGGSAPAYTPHVYSNFCMQEAFRQGGGMHYWRRDLFHIMRKGSSSMPRCVSGCRKVLLRTFQRIAREHHRGHVRDARPSSGESACIHRILCKRQRQALDDSLQKPPQVFICIVDAMQRISRLHVQSIGGVVHAHTQRWFEHNIMMLRQSSTPGHP